MGILYERFAWYELMAFSMTLGYVHEVILEGKVVEAHDPDEVACVVNNRDLNPEDGASKKQSP